MKILHTADWHIDESNIDFTVPVIEQAIANAPDYDVFVHAGDLAVHRGHVSPRVAFVIRRLILKAHQKAKHGSIVVAGNHDLNFKNDGAGMVAGVLGHHQLTYGVDHRMHLVETPRVIKIENVNFVCVPTPSKFALAEWEKNNDAQTLSYEGIFGQLVQGLIIDATFGKEDPCLVVYHGTVSGAKLGNEMVMKSGVDLALPHTAFRGADAVLAGHIHHQQIMRERPSVFYPGAAAPLTWNDKYLEPAMFLHANDGEGHRMYILPMQVISQMVDVHLDASEIDDTGPGSLLSFMLAAIPDCGKKDRVRVTMKAPGYLIDEMPRDTPAKLAALAEVASVKIVYERTDAAQAKVRLEKDWTVQTAFKQWCELKDVDPLMAEDAYGVIESIESAVIDGHLEANFECKPISIEVKNWCQYEKVRIAFDDLGRVSAVTGPNYVGKSNLMRLFLFSRYKRQAAGDNLSDLIRKGCETCKVTEIFEHHGKRYAIERKLKRTKSGGSRASLVLYRWTGTEWEVSNEETAAATQETIEAMIGPYELFRATTYAGQNDVDGLLDFTPSEMKDVLLSVLHRNFDDRLRIVKETIADLDAKLAKAEGDRERKARVEEAIRALKEQLAEAEANSKAKAKELADARKVLSDDQKAQTDAKERVAAARKDHEARHEAKQKISKLQKELSSLEHSIQVSKSKIGKAQAVSCDVVVPTEAELDAAIAVRNDARDELEEVRVMREEARDAAAAAVAEAHAEKETYWKGLATANNVVRDLKRQIEEGEKLLATIDQVPCGGQDGWSQGTAMRNIDMSMCPFLLSAITAKKMLPDLKQEYAVANHDAGTAKKMFADKMATVEEVERQAKRQNEQMNVAFADAQKEVGAAVEKVTELRILRKEGKAVRDAERTIKEEQAKIEIRKERLDAAQQEFAELNERISGMGDEDTYELAVLQLEEILKDISQSESLVDAFEKEYKRYVSAEGELTGFLKANEEHLEELKQSAMSADAHLNERALWYLAQEAFHRDGIPYLLLEQFAIPALHKTINNYLGATDIRVSLDNERELASGKVRSEVVLQFEDHRGVHPLSSASGFQRTAIGMALRNALADLHAMATGSPIWLSIQDEGFGTMDEGNLDKVKGTIREIAEKRGHFIFISHIPGMAEIADSTIEVTDSAGVSTASTNGSFA